MRKIGISIYPEQSKIEDNLKYIKKARNLGFDIIFMSILQFNKENFQKYKENYFLVIQEAKNLGFYVILDVADSAFEIMNCNVENLKPFAELGVSCLRLDSPLLPSQVAMSTYNDFDIDIQINVSNNDSFINNVLDYKPIKEKISGSHNFYPLKDSGLSVDFFEQSTNKFKQLNLNTMAFVGSENGIQGPVKDASKLVTLEMHRPIPIDIQAKHLFATNIIDWVVIGNAFASESELRNLANVKRNFISFKVNTDKTTLSEIESKIIFDNLHFRRGDISDKFIRSTMTRPKYAEHKIIPKRIKKEYNRGDLVILNDNAKHYKGELQIILKDGYLDYESKFNFIENLGEQNILLDYIDAWTKFSFYI